MNWKVYYLVFVALLVSSYSNSQSNLLNATEVDQIGKQTKEKIAQTMIVLYLMDI